MDNPFIIKTYKSKDGKYLHSTSFNKADLPLLATLCERACLAEISKQAVELRSASEPQVEEDLPF